MTRQRGVAEYVSAARVDAEERRARPARLYLDQRAARRSAGDAAARGLFPHRPNQQLALRRREPLQLFASVG
jgi:hypothetical protein